VVLGPVRGLLQLEGENAPLLALAHPLEDTAAEKTGAAIVGALHPVDAVIPDLQHHPQVVHLRLLGTVVAEAQVLEAVARVIEKAHLAPVHHPLAVEILGTVIGR